MIKICLLTYFYSGVNNSCLSIFQCNESNIKVVNSRRLLGCPSLQAVKIKCPDFNMVAFYWSPNSLLAEDLESAAKVLEAHDEDTTFWMGDLNFSETYSK